LVDEAMARARCVFPVPGAPCNKIPRGGLRPVFLLKQKRHVKIWLCG
jgi:hypothetical protein